MYRAKRWRIASAWGDRYLGLRVSDELAEAARLNEGAARSYVRCRFSVAGVGEVRVLVDDAAPQAVGHQEGACSWLLKRCLSGQEPDLFNKRSAEGRVVVEVAVGGGGGGAMGGVLRECRMLCAALQGGTFETECFYFMFTKSVQL